MRILWLAVALLLSTSVRADQISEAVGKLQRLDPRLHSRVTVWRTAICVGELLELAAEQTGAPVYADDLDGAAGEIVGVYVKNQPLGDLMESLASLLSERGAIWEWRKTVGRKGEVGYKLYSAASKSQGRLRAEMNQAYYGALENALGGRTASDEGAAQIAHDAPQALSLLRRFTDSAQRRSLIFEGTRISVPKSLVPEPIKLPESDSELVITRVQDHDLFPHLTLSAEVDDPELTVTESILRQSLRFGIQRWNLTDDSAADNVAWPTDTKIWTRHPDDGNSLDRLARYTGIPILVRGNFHAPRLEEMPIAPRTLDEFWEKLGRSDTTRPHCWSRKARGKTLLVRSWSIEDTGQYLCRMPWRFYKEARRRLHSPENDREVGNGLLWLMNATMGQSRTAFSVSDCCLIPQSIVSNMIGQTIVVADGILSSGMVDDLLGGIWGNPTLASRAFSPSGVPVNDLDLSMPSVVRTPDQVGLPDSMRSALLRLDVIHPLFVDPSSDVLAEADSKLIKSFRLGIRTGRPTVHVRVFLHPEDGEETLLRTYKLTPGRLYFKPPP